MMGLFRFADTVIKRNALLFVVCFDSVFVHILNYTMHQCWSWAQQPEEWEKERDKTKIKAAQVELQVGMILVIEG